VDFWYLDGFKVIFSRTVVGERMDPRENRMCMGIMTVVQNVGTGKQLVVTDLISLSIKPSAA